jgi:polysaccharide export outer membrane protein
MQKRSSQKARKDISKPASWWTILLFLLLPLALPMLAQNDKAKKETSEKAPVPATNDPGYVIGPQDVLDIDIWQEKELSRSVPVRPDGKISLPLLDDVQAAGLTPTQLADQLTTKFKKFVTGPQVTVIVTQINSQRVYILGESAHPGAYPLLPGMTVLQALSSAGGFTIFADLKKIYVLRKEGAKQEKFPFNYKEVIGGKNPEQNIELKAGDQIIVP